LTNGPGNAGVVTITAGSLSVDAAGNTAVTGISSAAQTGSTGNAGEVMVTTTGATTISNGAQIGSSTFARGSAGDVTLTAGTLTIDGGASAIATGITSSALSGSTGNAGKVAITSTGVITLSNGGVVESETEALGNAGDVTLKAASLNIDGGGAKILTGISSRANYGSTGNAGEVTVSTTGATTISNDGEILSTTRALGNAGDVTLTAGSLTIDGTKTGVITGISTQAAAGSRGDAGIVAVNVSGTADLNGGTISSTAQSDTGGQPGTVEIRAGTLVLGPSSLVAIQDFATVADPKQIVPTELSIQAGSIQMDGGQVSAASSGNIAASSIDISYQQTLHMDPSIISTTSNQGNGGPITITGLGPLWLQNSSITTSVLGTTNGNGGDIRITVPYIVLDSGVIQANTTAPKASGGDVVISADALVPSFESYVLGGAIVSFDSATLGENVVQAAAPDGVSGELNVTVPSLDLGSALLGLTGTPSTPIALSRSLCTYRPGSSLSIAGRGGLPVSYKDPLWIDLGEGSSGTEGEAKSGAGARAATGAAARATTGAAPAARRSVSGPPFQGLSFIACR
jgi:large exoprotein involved in heme utilization and adhesion